jgi:hypothetical protein
MQAHQSETASIRVLRIEHGRGLSGLMIAPIRPATRNYADRGWVGDRDGGIRDRPETVGVQDMTDNSLDPVGPPVSPLTQGGILRTLGMRLREVMGDSLSEPIPADMQRLSDLLVEHLDADK